MKFFNYITAAITLAVSMMMVTASANADAMFVNAVKSYAIKAYPYHAHKQPLEVIGSAIYKQATSVKISKSLLTAVISKESSFKTKVVSPSKAVGLTQVVPKWHQDKIRGRNLFDINTNVEVGATILRDCLVKSKGNEVNALRCYSGYPGKSGYEYARSVLVEKNKFENFKSDKFPLPEKTDIEVYDNMEDLLNMLTTKYMLKTESI